MIKILFFFLLLLLLASSLSNHHHHRHQFHTNFTPNQNIPPESKCQPKEIIIIIIVVVAAAASKNPAFRDIYIFFRYESRIENEIVIILYTIEP